MQPATADVPYLDFAIALFLGALVGIEREKTRREQRGIGGVRTFILFAIAGAVAGWLTVQSGSPWPLAATILVVGATIVAGYLAQVRTQPEAQGLTTEVAALVVTLLGAAATTGHREVAVALGIVTSAVLAFRVQIHGLVARIGEEDIYAGLKLLLATFVVLPLVPNRTIDPWDAVNPYRTWLLVILISALSLLGYVAVRLLGTARGFAVTGLFGGLVSSTAVSLAFAKRSREDGMRPALSGALAAGVLLAWAVMFFRVIFLVWVADAPLVATVWLPMTAMGLATAMLAGVLVRRLGDDAPQPDVHLRNPFRMTAAVQFALVVTALLVAVRLAQTYLPAGGMLVVAAVAGLADVDAVTLSMAAYAARTGDRETATAAIAIAALSNTAVKAGIVAVLAAPALRHRMLVAATVIFAVGITTLLLG